MSKDVKVFNGCNHIIDGTRYSSNNCPKCFGKNYYKDIAFDVDGKAVLCEGEIKLQQEVLKIMDDPKGGNKFHKEWGDILITDSATSIVGSKNLAITAQKIQIIIYETMMYLKGVQVNNQVLFKNMSTDEIIDQIVSINVVSYTALGYTIKVTFSNKEGQIYTQQILL
jgi:hypothetical protein